MKNNDKCGDDRTTESPFCIPMVTVFEKIGGVTMLGYKKYKQPKRARLRKSDGLRINIGEIQIGKMHKYHESEFGILTDPVSRKRKPPYSILINSWNYSYRRLPFGLNISSAEFQKCMDKILGNFIHEFVTI